MTTKTTDKAQIRAVIEEWADALRNKDANRMLSHCAPNLVHFSLAPPLLSTASNAEGLNAWFATWQGPIGYEIRDPGIMIGDDVAFSHSLNRMHGTKTNGAKADLCFGRRSASKGSKANGRWRTSTSQYPFTWMAASKPQSTLSRSWAASLEQMNKGEKGQSNGEKTTSAKKKFRTADEYFKGSKIPELEDQECSERYWCSADQVILPL